jgi:hypothetical protein
MSSQQWGCPVSVQEISTSNAFLEAPLDLAAPVYVSTEWIVFPTSRTSHANYLFYIKISAVGLSNSFFGPFTLHVGCTSESVRFYDNPGFITN